MAATRWSSVGASVLVLVLLLICQAWSSTAYNNQRTSWVTKHLARGGIEKPTFANRHLSENLHKEWEPIQNGWKASLVHENNRGGLSSLTSFEKIQRNAAKSVARARALDSKARTTTFRGKEYTSGHGRRKVLQVESVESPVESTLGSYSMAFSIGSPPQNFVAIADTGSDLIWVQCAGCTICFNQTAPFYSPTASSTYAAVGCPTAACSALGVGNELACNSTCDYTYSYGDQSMTTGSYVSDVVSLNATNGTVAAVPEINFGCGLKNSGTFEYSDGIVGLARGPISFPSQISAFLGNSTKFAYCLVSEENLTVSSPIVFGEAAVPANLSSVVYTPMLTPNNVSLIPYYYVNLTSISVGGVVLDIPVTAFEVDALGNGGTIFDSGTTYTVLTSPAYTPLLEAFTADITYQTVDLSEEVGLDLCYDVTDFVHNITVPTLTFNFLNADFHLPFDNYFTLYTTTDGTADYMCLTLMESDGMNIYGNTQQQNFQVIYDQDLLQVGWLPIDCTTL